MEALRVSHGSDKVRPGTGLTRPSFEGGNAADGGRLLVVECGCTLRAATAGVARYYFVERYMDAREVAGVPDGRKRARGRGDPRQYPDRAAARKCRVRTETGEAAGETARFAEGRADAGTDRGRTLIPWFARRALRTDDPTLGNTPKALNTGFLPHTTHPKNELASSPCLS